MRICSVDCFSVYWAFGFVLLACNDTPVLAAKMEEELHSSHVRCLVFCPGPEKLGSLHGKLLL